MLTWLLRQLSRQPPAPAPAAKPAGPVAQKKADVPLKQPTVSNWPSGVPNLYPGLTQNELCLFMDETEYLRIKGLRKVLVLPLYDQQSSEEEKMFGIGLQLLLIRDLRLHRDLSVLGPEDTPKSSIVGLDLSSARVKRSILVGGRVHLLANGFCAHLLVGQADNLGVLDVTEENFVQFILACAQGILKVLELQVNAKLRNYWQTGRPRGPEDLYLLGKLSQSKDRGEVTQIKQLLQARPGFVLPVFYGDDRDMLRALENDPHDVQILFYLHNRLWSGNTPEFWAFQFARRAIELSPGHGKAHMVLNNSAPVDANLYFHAELGYALLPDNTFALGNLLCYYRERKQTPKDLSIVFEAINLDPQHTDPYRQAIHFLKQVNRYKEALDVAFQLKKIVTPPLSERTIVCICQNPQNKVAYHAGKLNLLKEAEDQIALLQKKLAEGGSTR